jgi:putative two-component system response regulator
MTGGGAPPRILAVDDDDQVRRLLKETLTEAGYACRCAADAAEARSLVAGKRFEVALCDIALPGESGLALARFLHHQHPDIALVMVSATDDPEVVRTALSVAYGFVVKPFKLNEIVIAVANALRRRELEIENREHRRDLEERVAIAQEETIHRLSRAVEYRDPETGGHVDRMSQYCGLLARCFGLAEGPIRVASRLHDIGKLAVPDAVLLKPGPLNTQERSAMECHAEAGYQLLADSQSELLELAATIAWTHHERFDGRGYPRRLAGEDIPLAGRIAGVADVFDALTTQRVYRPAFPLADALTIIADERGGHFDPDVLDAFLESLDDVTAIFRRFARAPRVSAQGGVPA